MAAAGGHNFLMSGPPGSGKTLLARSQPSILPKMSRAEALEVTKIYSISGLLPSDTPLIMQRPYRAPRTTLSPTPDWSAGDTGPGGGDKPESQGRSIPR